MTEITGKTFWLVGASSGIGFALAEKLAESGNFVILTARSVAPLQALKQKYASKIAIVSGDITSDHDKQAIRSKLFDTTDCVDFLVLCAGTCEYDDGPKLDLDMYRRVFEVNFFAAVACVEIALPLLKRSSGTVVGISSLASVVPFPRAEAYGASKAAFEYLLQSLSVDLRSTGVGVSVVRPGFVDTPLTKRNDFDMPYMISADEAAQQIVKGMARKKSLHAFPWQLSYVLNFFSFFKSFWMSIIAANFRKQSKV